MSVDIETAGPTPATYSILSIGACLVDDPETTFYVELKPERMAFEAEAVEVSHLSLDALLARHRGEPPRGVGRVELDAEPLGGLDEASDVGLRGHGGASQDLGMGPEGSGGSSARSARKSWAWSCASASAWWDSERPSR